MEKIKEFISTNKLFLVFILCNLFNSTLLRFLTVKNYFNLKPFIADLGTLIIIGSFSYLFKNKNRYTYLLIMTIIASLICFVNSIYYNNYLSFVSISLIGSITFLKDVGNAVVDNVLEVKDFLFLLIIPAFILFYKLIGVEKNKKNFKYILLSGIIILGLLAPFYKGKDYARIWKNWNREYVVMQFGTYVYQIDDFVVSLKPSLVNLFGSDNASKVFREYYSNHKVKGENKYSNIFKDKNVLVIHAESLQNFVINKKINGKEITPNLNKLVNKSLYFNNFYALDSVGTSSDSEFTFSTSLLPTNNGTVFINYWNRKYETIQKKFNEDGYFTFSMHANNGTFWNRNIMYNSLGYKKFYNYENDYELDDIIGLGLSDRSFFKQSLKKIKNISDSGKKFYGTLITLSNHTPFTNDGKDLSDFDVSSYHYDKKGNLIIDDYLENTVLGSYIKSVHYADKALGEFINGLEELGILDNTVLIIYGDHDAKIKKNQFEYFYNYDKKTGKSLDKDSSDYKLIDDIDYELLRSVPFIIYSKDIEPKVINKAASMLDVFPTLANMFGFDVTYALGNDLFDDYDNIVVFPNGNWLTDKMYYDTKRDSFKALVDNLVVKNDYIENNNIIAQNKINISNYIIMYDLIKKNEEANVILKEK
mgnify:CR=1 FL=1